jgi:hypothetical protein
MTDEELLAATDEELMMAILGWRPARPEALELARRFRNLRASHVRLTESHGALERQWEEARRELDGFLARRWPTAPSVAETPVAGQGRGKTHCRCGSPLDERGTCVHWSHSQQYERSRMSYGLHTVAEVGPVEAASVTAHEPGCACDACFEAVRGKRDFAGTRCHCGGTIGVNGWCDRRDPATGLHTRSEKP